MKRRWLIAALGLAVAAVLGLLTLPRAAGSGPSALPTYRVERQSFERRVPAEGVLRAVKATPVTVPQSAPVPARLAWIAADGSPVSAGEVVIRFDPSELEQQLTDAESSVAAADLKLERHEAESAQQLRDLQRDSEAAELEFELAEQFDRSDEEIYSRHDIIESEIDAELAERRQQHAEAAHRTEAEVAAAQERIYALDRRKAELQRRRAADGLEALEVRAPHDGLLVLERDWQGEPPRVGESVWPGQPLAQIPDLAEMEAEVYVLEADAGGLESGRPAQVVVEAHPGRRYAATIRRVDSLARPRLRFSPVQYFSVTLELETTDHERMRPGQRVQAELLLAAVEDALVVPRQAVFEVEGENVVYRRRDGGYEAVPVTLGPSGPGRVVVESGLEEGDVIALADPAAPLPAADGGGLLGGVPSPGASR